jgi:hypothetical protein
MQQERDYEDIALMEIVCAGGEFTDLFEELWVRVGSEDQ